MNDLPDILRMGVSFVRMLDEDPCAESIVATAVGMIQGDRAVILMQGDYAMVGAVCVPHFFNKGKIIATELFWWVDEGHRGAGIGIQLLKGVESWAKGMGAGRLSMVTMHQADVSGLYEKQGFELFESTYIKDL